MATKTRVQIQFKALAILTGGDVGANPSAEDAAAIDPYIDSEAEEINADGSAYIDDVDKLKIELFMPFCKLVANAASDEFGGKSDFVLAHQLRNQIRVLARPTPGYGPQMIEWF